VGAFRRVRGIAGVAQLAANRHRRPVTPSYTGPRNTWSESTPSLVCHHPATQRTRLTVKQVHRESVLDIADPRHRRHPRCRRGRRRDHRGPGALSRRWLRSCSYRAVRSRVPVSARRLPAVASAQAPARRNRAGHRMAGWPRCRRCPPSVALYCRRRRGFAVPPAVDVDYRLRSTAAET